VPAKASIAAGRKALDKHLRALQDVIAVAGP